MIFSKKTYKHIFCGENNSHDDLVGFHHKGKKKSGDEIAYATSMRRYSTTRMISMNKIRRLYEGDVYRIKDNKRKKGKGTSTFFPLNWDRKKVKKSVLDASKKRIQDNYYYDENNDIVMCICEDASGKILTAYPVICIVGVNDEI